MEGPLDMTLPELLKHWADYRGDWPAFIFKHPERTDIRTVLTYMDLYTLGSRCAALLRKKGVRRQDVMLVMLSNSPERAIIEATALLLGAFSVPFLVRKDLEGSDLLAIAKHHCATAIVLDPDVHGETAEILRRMCELYDPVGGVVTSVRMPYLRVVLHVKRHRPENKDDFLYYLRNVRTQTYSMTPAPYPHHPCVVLSTAGGVGRPPKLVVHTHKNMVAFSKIFMPRTDSPRPMLFLNYPFGTVRGHLALSLCNPVTRILVDERAGSPLNLSRIIYYALTMEKCEVAVLPHDLVTDLAKYFVNQEESTFRPSYVGIIGEEVSLHVLSAALEFSHMVLVNYVSAELLVAAITMVSEVVSHGAGRPLQPGVFITITDDEGNELPSDHVGHLLIRSPLMFKGYLNDPTSTAASFTKDGFFKTGDFGHLVNDHLFIIPQIQANAFSSQA